MSEEFKIVLSGFKSKKHAKDFLDWFEGQGEQDYSYWAEINEFPNVTCDVKTGMIKHPDGYEYKLEIHE